MQPPLPLPLLLPPTILHPPSPPPPPLPRSLTLIWILLIPPSSHLSSTPPHLLHTPPSSNSPGGNIILSFMLLCIFSFSLWFHIFTQFDWLVCCILLQHNETWDCLVYLFQFFFSTIILFTSLRYVHAHNPQIAIFSFFIVNTYNEVKKNNVFKLNCRVLSYTWFPRSLIFPF